MQNLIKTWYVAKVVTIVSQWNLYCMKCYCRAILHAPSLHTNPLAELSARVSNTRIRALRCHNCACRINLFSPVGALAAWVYYFSSTLYIPYNGVCVFLGTGFSAGAKKRAYLIPLIRNAVLLLVFVAAVCINLYALTPAATASHICIFIRLIIFGDWFFNTRSLRRFYLRTHSHKA